MVISPFTTKQDVPAIHAPPSSGEGLSDDDRYFTENAKKWTEDRDTYVRVGYALSPKGCVYKYDADWHEGLIDKQEKIWP
jgi:hypothetical protein